MFTTAADQDRFDALYASRPNGPLYVSVWRNGLLDPNAKMMLAPLMATPSTVAANTATIGTYLAQHPAVTVEFMAECDLDAALDAADTSSAMEAIAITIQAGGVARAGGVDDGAPQR